jgi:hypothetical protein
MEDLVQQYIDQCVRIGLLTYNKIRKYPIRPGNLAVVIKIFSLYTKQSFEINNQNISLYSNYNVYLTNTGLKWFINQFKSYTFYFLRSTFPHVFANLKNIEDLETYSGLNNFKGLVGENYKAGTKNKAVLVRMYGINKIEYTFDTLVEARKELLSLSRYYPLEQFTLYYLFKDKKGVYYKQKAPLILESNRRGMAINLPHLKGKV